MSVNQDTVQKTRKPRKLGAGLTAPQREELLQIPVKGFVVVKPSSRELNDVQLSRYIWALNRNCIASLEKQKMIEPICIPGAFPYGYQLTQKGYMVAAALLAPPEPEPADRVKRAYVRRTPKEPVIHAVESTEEVSVELPAESVERAA